MTVTENAIAVALAFALGCGTTATIRRTDGPPIEAEIDSSDASMLRLRGPSGNIVELNQYQVASIDHPGNVMAAIGAAYAGSGLLLTLPYLSRRLSASDQGRESGFEGIVLAVAITAIVAGTLALVSGVSVWKQSKARAGPFEVARPPGWMIPPALPGKAEPIAPLRPPAGEDDEDQKQKPPARFHR